MKKIIYEVDGNLFVLSPAELVYINDGGVFFCPKPSEEIPDGFREATLDEIAAKDVPSGVPYFIKEESELPDRKLGTRHAWKLDGGSVIVDQDKVNLRNSEKEKKQAVLDKLKITEEEFKELGG